MISLLIHDLCQLVDFFVVFYANCVQPSPISSREKYKEGLLQNGALFRVRIGDGYTKPICNQDNQDSSHTYGIARDF